MRNLSGLLLMSVAAFGLLAPTIAEAQVAPPQLTSFSLASGTPIDAASTPSVTFDYTLAAGANSINGITFDVTDPNGVTFGNGSNSLTSGTFTPIGGVWINGTYTLSDVTIADSALLQVEYFGTGYVEYYPGLTPGSQADPISPPITITVTGGVDMIAAPTLNSISLLSNSIGQGEFLSFAVNITPGSIWPLSQFDVIVQDPNGGQERMVVVAPKIGRSQTTTVMVPTGGVSYSDPLSVTGAYTIVSVELTDGYSEVYYSPTGVTYGRVPEELGPNLSQGTYAGLGFTVYGVLSPAPPANPSGITIADEPNLNPVPVGSPANFSVTATGSSLTYQWSFNGTPIPGATAATYTIASAQTSDSGSYTVTITGPNGSLTSSGAVLAVAPAFGGPRVDTEPTSAAVVLGSTAVFNTIAAQAGATYQWYLNGTPLADAGVLGAKGRETPHAVSGTTSSTLLISNAAPEDTGSYSCLVSTVTGSSISNSAYLTIWSANDPDPGRLVDLSCRAQVGTGPGVLIAGFATGGSGTTGDQNVLIRASGPALAQFDLSPLLPDPVLGLYGSNQQQIASNSGWAGNSAIEAAASSVGAFDWTSSSSHDSALLQSLPAGAYTAEVSGASNDTGLGLVEVYDATPAGSYTLASPRLVNLSARIDSGTGANVLIAGFYIGGTTSKTVLIRGSGPALAQFSLSGLLPDPELQVFDSTQTLIASNTGWEGSPQISAVAASVGAFSWGNSATPDSALLLTLPPGAYTAQVSGASGDSGMALVEIYDVP